MRESTRQLLGYTVAESLFSSLTRERIRKRVYKTRDLARTGFFDSIEGFYNRTRRHSHLVVASMPKPLSRLQCDAGQCLDFGGGPSCTNNRLNAAGRPDDEDEFTAAGPPAKRNNARRKPLTEIGHALVESDYPRWQRSSH